MVLVREKVAAKRQYAAPAITHKASIYSALCVKGSKRVRVVADLVLGACANAVAFALYKVAVEPEAKKMEKKRGSLR